MSCGYVNYIEGDKVRKLISMTELALRNLEFSSHDWPHKDEKRRAFCTAQVLLHEMKDMLIKINSEED